MSSLAATQADGFYWPADHDPRRGVGLNKLHGTHALGKRASKLDQGILVVRFELPHHGWCLGCGEHLGRGVRFNAEKRKVGKYHSSVIWAFDVKCPLCPQRFEIRNDPQSRDYLYVSGIRRKEMEFDAEAVGVEQLNDEAHRAKMAENPLFAAAHAVQERRSGERKRGNVEALAERAERVHRDDYEANKALRRRFRGQKRERKALAAEGAALGLPMPLVPRSATDAAAAARATFRPAPAKRRSVSRQLRRVGRESIFARAAPAASVEPVPPAAVQAAAPPPARAPAPAAVPGLEGYGDSD